jgi:hypothetical protein
MADDIDQMRRLAQALKIKRELKAAGKGIDAVTKFLSEYGHKLDGEDRQDFADLALDLVKQAHQLVDALTAARKP